MGVKVKIMFGMLFFVCIQTFSQSISTCGFSYKKVITIQGAQVSGGPHTDFPVLISEIIPAAKLTSANGYDVIFADDNGDLLDFQIEKYDNVTGEYISWVKIPSLTNGTDVDIHMLYGKASITTDQSTTNTWDGNFVGSWHMGENPGGAAPQVLDATSNINHGTSGGGMNAADVVGGKIGDCLNFDGTNDYIDIPNAQGFANSGAEFSISCWINTSDPTNNNMAFVGNYHSTGQTPFFMLGFDASNAWMWTRDGSGNSTRPTTPKANVKDGTWHHFAGIRDQTANTLSIYVDGSLVNSIANITGDCRRAPSFYFMDHYTRYTSGMLDEVHISSVARSANWIATEYASQNSPASFYTTSAEIDNNYNSTGDGDWDNTGIWNNSVAPHVGANVIIDQNVDIDANSTDYTICDCNLNSTGATSVRLDMSNNRHLRVIQDFGIALSGTGTNTAALNISSDAQLTVSGNFSLSNSNSSGDPNADIQLRDNSQLNLTGNLTMTLSNGDDAYVDMEDNSVFNVGGDVIINQSGGDELGLILDDNAIMSITGSIDATMDGGDDMRFTVNNNSGDAAILNVGTNFLIDQNGGDDVFVRVNNGVGNNGQMNIIGNFDFDKDGGDDIRMLMNGSNSLFSVGGFVRINMTSTGTDDVTLDLDQGNFNVTGNLALTRENDSHEILVNMDGANMTLGGLILQTTGSTDTDHSIWFNVDEASVLTVNGDVLLDMDGGNNIELEVNNRSGDDGIIDINGNMTIDQDGGNDIDFTANGLNSVIDISGNLIVNHDGGDDVEFRIDSTNSQFLVGGTTTINWNSGADDLMDFNLDKGTMTLSQLVTLNRLNDSGPIHLDLDGANFNANAGLNVTINGTLSGDQAVWIDVDEGSIFNVTGLTDIDMSGGDDFHVFVDVESGGSTSQAIFDGNVDIDKSGGDDVEFFVDDNNSIINITGNFDYTSTGGEELLIDIDNDGRFDVDGDFTINHSNGEDNEIDLEFNAGLANPVFNVDGNMSIIITGGDDEYLLDLNGGTFTVGQNLTLTNTGAGGSEDIEVQIDEDAILSVGGNLIATLSGGDDVFIDLGNNSTNSTAQLNVTGSVTLDHNGNTGGDDMYVNFRDNTRGNIGANLILDSDYSGGDQLYVRENTTAELDVIGNISFIAGSQGLGEIELNDASILRIGGNFLRSTTPGFGILDANDLSTVEFNGTGSQIIPQDAGLGTDEFDFQNVIIRNTFGTSPQLSMEGDMTVHGIMDFQDGIISSTTTEILVIDDDALVVNASDASHVDGWVRKIGNDVFIFPVGDADKYRSIGISAPTGASSQFEANYNFTNPDPLYDVQLRGAGVHHVSVLEYWLLEETGPGSPAVIVTLSWDAVSEVQAGNEGDLIVAHFTGGQWESEGAGVPVITGLTGTLPSFGLVGSFSPFTLGTSTKQNPLPVEFISFEGQRVGGSVELNWSTASEVNNDFFTVQRSEDGIEWHDIVEVNGVGNSNVTQSYLEFDHNPSDVESYYRIKQTDFDGKTSYSSIEVIGAIDHIHEVVVYPNPANHTLHIEVHEAQEYSIQLFDILGHEVNVNQTYDHDRLEIDVNLLTPGVYVLRISNGSDLFEKKVVVDR